MTANFLVGLREGLEATLVVVLLMAYLTKIGRRDRLPYMWIGISLAVLVSAAFGALLTFGPRGLTFQAQEAIGGSLSLLAVGFVTWMIFFMACSARTMGADLRGRVDTAVAASGLSLILMAALAVGREGLETALFLWAATQAQGGAQSPFLAALAGILVAVALGALIHRGALRINLGKFFSITGFALIFVAAGVLSYGIHDLQEARFLPGLRHLAFDISHVLAPTSLSAVLLKGIFNFSPATTWLEAIAWLLYAGITSFFYLAALRRNRQQSTAHPGTAQPSGSSKPDSSQPSPVQSPRSRESSGLSAAS